MHRQLSSAAKYEMSIDCSLFEAERAIGYVVPGRLLPDPSFGNKPEADLKDMTRRLHSVRTELASLGFVTRYALTCSDFLIEAVGDIHDKILAVNEEALCSQEEVILEQLEHLKSRTQCLQSHALSLQERAQSQTNLVSSASFCSTKPLTSILSKDI